MQGIQIPINTRVNYEYIDKDFILFYITNEDTQAIIIDKISEAVESDIPFGVVVSANVSDAIIKMLEDMKIPMGIFCELMDYESDNLSDDELAAKFAKSIGLQCTRSVRNRFAELNLIERPVSIMRYPAFDSGVYNAGSPLSPDAYSNLWQYSTHGTSTMVKDTCKLVIAFGCDTIEQYVSKILKSSNSMIERTSKPVNKISAPIANNANIAESEDIEMTIDDVENIVIDEEVIDDIVELESADIKDTTDELIIAEDDIPATEEALEEEECIEEAAADMQNRLFYDGSLTSISKISIELGIEDTAEYRKELAEKNNISYTSSTDLNKKLIKLLRTTGVII